MRICQRLLARLTVSVLLMLTAATPLQAQEVTRVAAAAQLRFVMEDIATQYRARYPGHPIEVQYGSSGRFHAQIINGAPFDVYLSADLDYPAALMEAGFTASEVLPYAIGRIAIWSNTVDARQLTLTDLADDQRFRRVAIANPRHAPYGARAREALISAGVWETLQPRLVTGENISSTLQLVQSGAAEVGIIALALVMTPEIAAQGGHRLIDGDRHLPLEQGLVVTRRAEQNAVAWHFAEYVRGAEAGTLFRAYGYDLPTQSP
ncbi:molybdate ABC transporter substrate-binding protein [Saccharospirillum impatiens]|uniref:molybdate ABC transporter substrate-binding protein n=1 Tax=Saccharospirillum impatiens TaxID=169438 RepID=UPI000413DA6E|nr:molybdate ABC transporter substrate-binding protein [Saccharospirillum impatiens]